MTAEPNDVGGDYKLDLLGMAQDTPMLVVEGSKVRHVRAIVTVTQRYPTLCHLVPPFTNKVVRDATPDDWGRDICGACVRTLPAQLERKGMVR